MHKKINLFIAEKPELAKAIVAVLGKGQRKEGYIACEHNIVTWCFGHMLALYDPEDYNKQHKRWNISHLPLVYIPWRKKVPHDKKRQVSIIKTLLDQAETVVHAGDPDEEGQLLVDELLQHLKCKVPVKRLLINDNNPQVIKKALNNMKDNSHFSGLSSRAEARSVADQLYGYNMTRLYTLAARQKGYQHLLTVGRVQTPILGLVVRRDQLNATHKKTLFYVVKGTFIFNDTKVEARYCTQEADLTDDKKRLTEKGFAEKIAALITNKPAVVIKSETREKKQSAPLPYNLLKLQADASRKFNIKPDQVLKITQSLREKHKLITYNRSDCEYLSDEQHEDAPAVLNAIAGTANVLSGPASAANPNFKSRAFNSKKVGAHHGIVPTQTTGNFSRLTDQEQKIYLLIARAYIAQFFPLYVYKETVLEIHCEKHPLTGTPLLFTVTGRIMLSPGWLTLYRNDKGNTELPIISQAADFSNVRKTMQGICQKGQAIEQETQPPPLYTMSTLLKDLTRISKYVEDPIIRQLLREKDKDKAGEYGGIGTPATRSAIIHNLFERQFLQEKGKKIISTTLGKEFFNLLPEAATRPDMTAKWHAQQKEIETGELTVKTFINQLVSYLSEEIERIKTEGLNIEITGERCPGCQRGVLTRRKGKNGFFMGCSRYPECKATYPCSGKKQQRITPTMQH